MKTPEIKTIEQQLSMYAALGVNAYFSKTAQELKERLRELRETEIKKHLKTLQN